MAKKNKLDIKGRIGKIDQSKHIEDSEVDSNVVNEDIDNDIKAESLDEFDQSLTVKGSKIQSKWSIIIPAIVTGVVTIASYIFSPQINDMLQSEPEIQPVTQPVTTGYPEEDYPEESFEPYEEHREEQSEDLPVWVVPLIIGVATTGYKYFKNRKNEKNK